MHQDIYLAVYLHRKPQMPLALFYAAASASDKFRYIALTAPDAESALSAARTIQAGSSLYLDFMVEASEKKIKSSVESLSDGTLLFKVSKRQLEEMLR